MGRESRSNIAYNSYTQLLSRIQYVLRDHGPYSFSENFKRSNTEDEDTNNRMYSLIALLSALAHDSSMPQSLDDVSFRLRKQTLFLSFLMLCWRNENMKVLFLNGKDHVAAIRRSLAFVSSLTGK